MTHREKLLAFTPDVIAKKRDEKIPDEIIYKEQCDLRCAAFEEHVQAMTIPPSLNKWAGHMRVNFGAKVKVHHVTYDSWIVALMVVRYGEAIEHWPVAFTEDDALRAKKWLEGKTPRGVSYPTSESWQTMKMLSVLLAIGGALLSWLHDPNWLWAMSPLLGSAATDYFENQQITHLFRTGLTTLNAWQASTAYSVGDIVRPGTWNNRLFQCVVAGTSAGAEPSWDTVIGNETVDNGATWIAVAVGLPKRAHFVGAYTAAPGETGGGTEVTGGSYARVKSIPLDANWNAASGGNGLTDNAVDIVFPAPTANWGLISHFAAHDRATGGNMHIYGALGTSKTVNNGDPAPKFSAGALDMTFA